MKIVEINIKLFTLVLLLVLTHTTFAQQSNITISTAATSGGSWNAGAPWVFTPTSDNAVINITEIQNKNAAANVTINTACGACTQTGNIIISGPINVDPTTNTTKLLSITANGTITLNSSCDIDLVPLNDGTTRAGGSLTLNAGTGISISSNINLSGAPANNNTSGAGGALTFTTTNGNISKTGSVTYTTSAGTATNGSGAAGGAVSFTANNGTITVGDIVANGGGASNNPAGAGGNISFSSTNGASITCGNITTSGGANTTSGGKGGDVTITMNNGSITVGNITSVGSTGNNAASKMGGTISLSGTSVSCGGIDSRAGDASNGAGVAGGSITVTASSGNIAITGELNSTGGDASNANAGAGGTIQLTANSGSITSSYNILANGSNTGTGGGAGGTVIISANTVAITGGVSINTTGRATGNAVSITGTSGITLNANITTTASTTNGPITINDGNSTITSGGANDGQTGGNINCGSATFTKSGSGKFVISQANSWTGATVISAGSLVLSAADRISNSSNMTLSGGTFSTGATTGYSETIGTLNLSANSGISLGSGSHTLQFSASNAVGWTGGTMLTIYGWGGTWGDGSSGTGGKIKFGAAATGLTAGQLAQIQFNDGSNNWSAQILASGEVVPLATLAIPAITLAAPGHPAAGNICASTTRNSLFKFTLAVTTANATLNQVNFTTTGSATDADITNFKLFYKTSDDLSTATEIKSIAGAVAGAQSFTGLSQAIASGATGYLWIVADIAASPTADRTVAVSAMATGDLTFASGTKSGSAGAGNSQTIKAKPTITSSAAAAGICNGSSVNLNAGGGSSYTWSSGGSANPTSVSPASNTTYTVTGTDANTCTNTSTVAVAVYTANAGADQTKCSTTGAITLTATGGGAYSWSSGDATAATSVNPGSTTTYTVSVTNSGIVCTDNAIVTVVNCNNCGTGLAGAYHNNQTWSSLADSRTDATINFAPWSNAQIFGAFSRTDDFSVRWTGYIVPLYSETYTFHTLVDDGLKITIGGNQIMNVTYSGSEQNSSTIALVAGTAYTIQLDYYEAWGGEGVYLKWSSASQAKQIVPQSQLFPAVPGCTPDITLAAPGHPAAGNICAGTTKQSLFKYTLAVTNSNATLNQVNFTTTGSATESDISNFKLFYKTSDDLSTATEIASIVGAAAGAQSFTGLTQAINSGTTGYLWIVADIAASPTVDRTVAVSAMTTGDLTFASGNKSGSAGAGNTQTIKAKPTITSSAAASPICAGASVNLSAGGGSTYLWSTTQTGTPVSVSPSSNTTYTVTGTDANGCTNTSSVAVAVNASPTVTASSDYSYSCANASVSLSASGATTYAWSSGGTGTPITVTPAASTTYTVTGTTSGCTGTATVGVIVNPTATATNNGPVSLGASLNVNVNPAGTGYIWEGPDGYTSSSKNPTVSASATAAMAGTYTVTVTYNGGCTSTATTSVTVNTTPADVVLASYNEAGFSAYVKQGSTNNRFYQFRLIISSASTTLTQLDFSTSGVYNASDLDNFKLWYSTTTVWSTATQIGSTLTSSLGSGSHQFTGLSQSLAQNDTVFFWLTADVDAAATANNKYVVSPGITTSGLTFSNANKSGSSSVGANQTIISSGKTPCTSPPAETTYPCSGTEWDGNTMNSGTGTRYQTGTDTYGSATINDNNTLIICGNLTMTSLGINSNTTIVIKSGATLTLTGGLNSFNGTIINYGTVISSSTMTANAGGIFMNASSSSYLSVAGSTTLNFPFYNFGKSDFAASVHINGGGSICLGSGATMSIAGALGNDVTNAFSVPIGAACLYSSYTGAQHQNNQLTSDSSLNITKASGVTIDNPGSASFSTAPSCEILLPIELLYLQGKCNNNSITLSWATASESNNDKFIIERSTDAIHFEPIFYVNGAGNSNSKIKYSATDKVPEFADYYYRLTQVDYDGQFEVFPLVAVTCEPELQKSKVAIAPNPIKGNVLNFTLTEADNQYVQINILDELGRIIKSETMSVSESMNVQIDLDGNLSKGMYILRITSPRMNISEKFFVE